MTPEEVNPQASDALVRAVEGLYATVYMSGGLGRIEFTEDGFQAWYLAEIAAVLPAHEAMVRAKVAEQLRADAAAHRRLVARKPTEHDEARLTRATCLDHAASRITRGEDT